MQSFDRDELIHAEERIKLYCADRAAANAKQSLLNGKWYHDQINQTAILDLN